jgi:hypothetical protein
MSGRYPISTPGHIHEGAAHCGGDNSTFTTLGSQIFPSVMGSKAAREGGAAAMLENIWG